MEKREIGSRGEELGRLKLVGEIFHQETDPTNPGEHLHE